MAEKSDTVPVRLPDDVATSLLQMARLQGRSQAEVMQEAWDRYKVTRRDEWLTMLDELRAEIETWRA